MIDKIVDLLEDRGVKKYTMQRTASSITVSLPNEPESSVQRYLEELRRTDSAFRDPRDDRTIIIEITPAAIEPDRRDELVRVLKSEEQELRRRGITSLLLFGSAAKPQSQPNDVDLLARYRPDARLSAFDVAGIRLYLEDRLGRRVDLSNERGFPAEWKGQAERYGVRIFGP